MGVPGIAARPARLKVGHLFKRLVAGGLLVCIFEVSGAMGGRRGPGGSGLVHPLISWRRRHVAGYQ
jgi:hypothetical protein